MEFQAGHALEGIHAQELPDPAQAVVNAAAVEVEFGGHVLD
jgi:hypothetical protein